MEETKICQHCGAQISLYAEICPRCGVRVAPVGAYTRRKDASDRSWLATLLLCIFFGGIGVHRFYVGKIGTGILMILTCGGFGIWWMVDLIMIILKRFQDKEGFFVCESDY